MSSWLDEVRWDAQGLVTAIAQDAHSQRILMVAYMNRESLQLTAQTGIAHYFSRSRQRLWKKGEESGHLQTVSELRLDCDGDVIVMQIVQAGGIACHTGRESCLYRKLVDEQWVVTDAVLKDPGAIYGGHASH
ncbi:phosphoribosyl-AMP cyclohydrolase [Chitinimonas sp. JJ19]|uniref:phosphoribosyl-AMP cyclohydrolase n=1 Tax=Chitinimonas sp. JJ19 TaxID=3109352 RepID=UPI0030026587